MLFNSLLSGLAFGSLAFAGVVPRAEPPTPVLAERQAASTTPVPDGQCTHGPQQRFCWTQGYSISTDFDAKVAPEGVEVKYDLEITNTTMPNPDGSGGLRQVMLVNNQYPGPTLRGKWGDTFVITVKNSLQHNGTGIHWHGIRQLNSCQHDGVPGVSECPIAPGKTRTYRFRATQFGTTWYHSHWSIQYGDGVVGALVIDGPAVSNYDVDLGPLPLTDWYYTPAFTLNEVAQAQGFPPPAQNILVNGTHINPNGGGQYAKITVKKGKKYRLRLISMSVDSYFSVSMDGHPFTVITSDFVPIRPYVTDQVTLAIGQRYDVIISANQTDDKNYWFRVSTGCANNDINKSKIQLGAILHYESGPSGNPTSTTNVTMRTTCADETNLIPFVPNQVPKSLVGSAKELDLNSFRDPNAHNHFRWTIDGSPMIVDFNDPTLETVLAKSENFYNNSNVVSIQHSDWTLWWIQTNPAAANPKLAHPIHLHGHDFYIVGKGSGVWDGSTTGLNFDNPTRRDTATLPAGPPGGYLLMAFPADNPGMWIIHCHIAWHASQGLSFQFGERYSDIRAGSLGDTGDFKKGCDEWDKYWYPGTRPDKPYNQTDSGI